MEGVLEMSRARMGMTVILDDADKVVGIFTDGDLRRALERGVDLLSSRMAELMTHNPRTIGPNSLAAEAVELMERYKVNHIVVVDDDMKLLGALNMHDLLQAKVI